MRIVTLIALLVGSPALAQSGGGASDRIEGPDPAEVEAFKKAAERFNARTSEIRSDTLAFVDYREQEARGQIAEIYDTRIDELAELERNQRELVIQRFNTFLSKYPDSEYSSHVRFRLADLYFEIENEDWLERSRVYYARLNDEDLSLAEAEELEAQGEPKLDLANVVALYKRIIADNADLPPDEAYERLDGVYLMLGFVYAEENAALPERDHPETLVMTEGEDPVPFDAADADQVAKHKADLAKATFRDLIAKIPDSDLADRAHLFLGNFLFDEGKFDEAVAEYQHVYDKGEDGKFFDESIYQLAWSYYKTDVYDKALPLFTEVLDRSEKLKEDTGRGSDYRSDAARYMAFTFVDLGVAEGDALDQGRDYFRRAGERSYEHDIFEEMADVLMRYSRLEEALAVYRYLQDDPRWVHHPENPEYQMSIVRLYGNTELLDDLVAAGEERLALTGRYNEGSDWWEANRSNPEALATARGFIENSLGQVALELRVRAQESGEATDFLAAARKYQEYLDKFPISDDYYEVQWVLADSLRQGGEIDAALAEYEALIRSSKYHPYYEGALVFRLQIRNQQLVAAGPVDALPADAAVERTYTTESGKEIQVYALGERQARFIEAADQVLAHEFGEPAQGVQDFRPFIEDNRHALMYVPAQILFYHNRFDEARARLDEVIDRYPRKDEASYAAGLTVDSYIAEGDLGQVRAKTKLYSTMVLGTADVPDPDGKFRSTLEGTAFKQAEALAQSGDSLATAEAFLAFLEEFPDSENKEYSLYNAAFYYQQGGKAERANELYEEFLAKYPDHEFAEKLYFRIASLYESTLQLDRAVDYYDQLSRRFPDNQDAPDAVYNAAFLQIGLGNHRDAARGLEAYANRYPDREDAEKVYFQAGESWEEVSTREGLSFYDRYLKKFGYANPDNALTAMARRADIYQELGQTRSYERELDKIDAAFDQIVGQGGELGPNAHKYAAMAAIRSLRAEYEDFSEGELVGNEDKDLALLEKTKAAVPVLEDRAKVLAAKYDNFEYSSEALLVLAKVPLYYAELGLSLDCPKNLSEDDCYDYLDILEEKVYPQYRQVQEEVAIPRLTGLIDKARQLKRHSPSIEEAMRILNDISPSDYPAVKDELLGETDSSAPTPIRGVEARAAEDRAPEEEE